MITLLVSSEELCGTGLEIAGSRYRHLFRARRRGSDEKLRLTDGQGRARWARIDQIDRLSARLRLESAAPPNESGLRVTLVVAAPRAQRAAWMVEKVTEVGVVAVRLVNSERTVRRYGGATLDRLRRVAGAAVEQCHRAVVPEITGMHDWDELDALLSQSDDRWMLDTAGGERLVARGGSVALIVGPEGGWSRRERLDLEALGCRAANLGPRTLRVETAAVVGCARILLG